MMCQAYRGIRLYSIEGQNANEVMLFSHGSYKNKKGRYTLMPAGMSMYWYTFHGSYGASSAAALVSGDAEGPNKLDYWMGMERTAENARLVLGRARVSSICPPGTRIWDYGLSGHEEGPDTVEKFSIARGAGRHSRDLILIDEDTSVKLSDVFKTLEKIGVSYGIMHYLACRVESKTGFKVDDRWDSTPYVNNPF